MSLIQQFKEISITHKKNEQKICPQHHHFNFIRRTASNFTLLRTKRGWRCAKVPNTVDVPPRSVIKLSALNKSGVTDFSCSWCSIVLTDQLIDFDKLLIWLVQFIICFPICCLIGPSLINQLQTRFFPLKLTFFCCSIYFFLKWLSFRKRALFLSSRVENCDQISC